jgi:hypothetical protein
VRFCCFAGFLFILTSGPVPAEEADQCDCTPQNLGAYCHPTISRHGKTIKITSSVPECSRVDWYSDDRPQVTLVKNHVEEFEWPEADRNSILSVLSCRICKQKKSATPNDPTQSYSIPVSSPVDSRHADMDISGNWNCYETDPGDNSSTSFIAAMNLASANGADYSGTIRSTTTGESEGSGSVYLSISKVFEFSGKLSGTSLAVQYADDSSIEKWTVSEEVIEMPEGWQCTR